MLAAVLAAALAADAPLVELLMNQPPAVLPSAAGPKTPPAGFVVLRGAALPPLAAEQVDVRQPLAVEAAFAVRTRGRVRLSASIDWGDGASTPAEVRPASSAPPWLAVPAELARLETPEAQHGRIVAEHGYAAAEMYTVRVTLVVAPEGGGPSSSFTRVHRVRVRDPALKEQPWRFDIGPITAYCGADPCVFPLPLEARMEARAPFRFGPSWLAGQTARWDWGDGQPSVGTVSAMGGVGRASGLHAYAKGGRFQVQLAVTARHKDGTPESRTQTIDIVVADVNIDGLSAPPGSLPARFPAHFQATFRYADPKRTRRAKWSWGDGQSDAGELTERAGVGSVVGEHTFQKAGVYKVQLTISDGLADVSAAAEVTVSSPGQVMATGTIPCPAGVFLADPKATGQAQVELNARHDGAAPSGIFRLSAGSLEFVSDRIESLAIQRTEAHAAGTGTVNGRTPYAFTVDVWTVPAADGRPEMSLARVRIRDVARQAAVFDNDVFDGALQPMTGASLTFEPE